MGTVQDRGSPQLSPTSLNLSFLFCERGQDCQPRSRKNRATPGVAGRVDAQVASGSRDAWAPRTGLTHQSSRTRAAQVFPSPTHACLLRSSLTPRSQQAALCQFPPELFHAIIHSDSSILHFRSLFHFPGPPAGFRASDRAPRPRILSPVWSYGFTSATAGPTTGLGH